MTFNDTDKLHVCDDCLVCDHAACMSAFSAFAAFSDPALYMNILNNNNNNNNEHQAEQ